VLECDQGKKSIHSEGFTGFRRLSQFGNSHMKVAHDGLPKSEYGEIVISVKQYTAVVLQDALNKEKNLSSLEEVQRNGRMVCFEL
jgi:hypothetical protein